MCLRCLSVVILLALGGCERELRPFGNPEKVRAEQNAHAVAQGKLLFRWLNCAGCHAQGGGGMGVALMDREWRYGADPDSVFTTIMDGRPNGMPAFRGRVTEDQARQLAAYVRSMSGLVAKDVAPGRSDSLSASEPENMRR
jgi:cytochrome c oxidase cbb3-type subunit III